jgi:hypothetical protein
MVSVVAASDNDLAIAVSYDSTGLLWADMTDHNVVGWVCDDTGQASSALPCIVGPIPATPPLTLPVVSPRWAVILGNGQEVVTELGWRGPLPALFDWIATNNGAQRLLRGQFSYSTNQVAWSQWASANPQLVWSGAETRPLPLPPEEPEPRNPRHK